MSDEYIKHIEDINTSLEKEVVDANDIRKRLKRFLEETLLSLRKSSLEIAKLRPFKDDKDSNNLEDYSMRIFGRELKDIHKRVNFRSNYSVVENEISFKIANEIENGNYIPDEKEEV